MSETKKYFCVFCDTIVLSLDTMREHLVQHLATDEEGYGEDRQLSETERRFVDRLVDYELKVNNSFEFIPKVLPKDNVQTLMIGCPLCDALIHCFRLMDDVMDDKDLCNCLQPSQDMASFRCEDCNQLVHYDCAVDSEVEKCFNCSTKNFEICPLRGFPKNIQQQHCYQHLNYYPFVCLFESNEEICGQNVVTVKGCETHLHYDHNQPIDESKDNCRLLTKYFEYNPIPKIESLINARLNSKHNIPSAILTPPILTAQNLSCIEGTALSTSEFMTNIGLGVSNGSRFDGIKRSLDSNNNSMQYSAQCLDRNESNSNGFVHKSAKKSKRSASEGKRKKRKKESKEDINLISICGKSDKTVNKRRGRPPKHLSSTPIDYSLSPIDGNIAPEPEVEAIDADLSHNEIYINWFTRTKRIKYPYFPQKDDEVYYLPFGHQLYKEEVMRRGLYNQSNKNFTMRHFIYERILAKVSKIDFLFKERRKTQTVIRCIYVTLKPIGEDKDKYGTIIHVKYHDMEGVDDFMILREHYESGVERQWSIGEQFRSLVDENYWFGEVVGINDSQCCNQTLFRKYVIKWLANGEIENLSPWEMEPIEETMLMYDPKTAVPISDEDREAFFRHLPYEWPKFNEKQELRRVANGLKIILNMDKTKEFPILSDITDSHYREKILYPIDLKILIERVENRFYRRHLSIKYDIKFMEANVRKLIKSVRRDPDYRFEESVAKRLKYHTKFVTALCLLFIDTHECTNPYDLYNNIDDYLETHDVKCYSAKRVHLNKVKKNPNLLPTVQKRLPKRPQSFGDAKKMLKIFASLRNTGAVKPKEENTGSAMDSKGCFRKTKSETFSNPHSKKISPVKARKSIVPYVGTSASDYKYSASPVINERFDSIDSYDNCRPTQQMDYSSDVSFSENEYNVCEEGNDSSDNAERDPDFKTTTYFKNKLF